MAAKHKKPKSAGKKAKSTTTPGFPGEFLIVPIEHLRPNPWNYNEMPEISMAKLRATIAQDGFVDPITAYSPDKSNPDDLEILDGEHRWYCARELGMKTAPTINLGYLTLEQAKALTIKLNELRGRPDVEKLAVLVKEITDNADKAIVNSLPFDEAQLQQMNRMARVALEGANAELDRAKKNAGQEKLRQGKKLDDKFDLYTVLRLGHMSEPEEHTFVSLLRKYERLSGTQKPPFVVLMDVLRKAVGRLKRRAKQSTKENK